MAQVETAVRKYERDVDLLLAEEFAVSPPFAAWFLAQTSKFAGADANVQDVFVSKSDNTGESDLLVVFERADSHSRFALHIEDKIDAPLQPKQEERYRLRAQNEVLKNDYSDFEVVLCSPESYCIVHPEAKMFDSCVSYESISEFLKHHDLGNPRSLYRANFLSTIAVKNANTWAREDDGRTNRFWSAAYKLATADFPNLEMKERKLTKDSNWITFRPMEMPTQPRLVYISLKGSLGYADMTFTRSLAHLFQPLVKQLLEDGMTVHQTGKSSAIRIEVTPFKVSEPDEMALSVLRISFAACVRLVRFYRKHRDILDKAADQSDLSLEPNAYPGPAITTSAI